MPVTIICPFRSERVCTLVSSRVRRGTPGAVVIYNVGPLSTERGMTKTQSSLVGVKFTAALSPGSENFLIISFATPRGRLKRVEGLQRKTVERTRFPALPLDRQDLAGGRKLIFGRGFELNTFKKPDKACNFHSASLALSAADQVGERHAERNTHTQRYEHEHRQRYEHEHTQRLENGCKAAAL